jgi:hypothetical protein
MIACGWRCVLPHCNSILEPGTCGCSGRPQQESSAETAPNVGWQRSFCRWFRCPNGTTPLHYVPVHSGKLSLATGYNDRLESLFSLNLTHIKRKKVRI